MTLTKWIKGNDDFGHQIQLNFNRNGGTVNTVCGGILSFLIRWGLRVFLLIKILTVVNLGSTNTSSNSIPINLEELGEVKADPMKILVYHRFLSTSFDGIKDPIVYDQKRHL